jgi:hypothetical protein
MSASARPYRGEDGDRFARHLLKETLMAGDLAALGVAAQVEIESKV